MTNSMLFVHILGGYVAVATGYVALFSKKGAPLHRRAGLVFVGAMIIMGVGAAYVGLARDLITWTGGITAPYFVITGLRTVRRRSEPTPVIDGALLLIPLFFGVRALLGGIEVWSLPGRQIQGIPAVAILMSATALLLAAAGDIRVLLRGPLRGTQRLARHLWRMLYALFAATGSFFLVESRVPEFLRITPLRLLLAFLPLIMLLYWLWRVRRRGASIVTRVDTPVGATAT